MTNISNYSRDKKPLTPKMKTNRMVKTKWFSNLVTLILVNETDNSPLHQQYWKTWHCSNSLDPVYNPETGETELSAERCKKRWCLTCQRIKARDLILSYKKSISELEDLQFLTLTAETVPADQLLERLEIMKKVFSLILKNAKYKKHYKINGIKKIEVTVRPGDKYHPHIHLICDHKKHAEFIKHQWVKLMCKYASHSDPSKQVAQLQNQKLIPGLPGVELEIFKYFTKLTTDLNIDWKTKEMFSIDKNGNHIPVSGKKLDHILQCLQKTQIVKSFGAKMRKTPKELWENSEEVIQYIDELYDQTTFFNSDNYYTIEGVQITNYQPNPELVEIIDKQLMPERLKNNPMDNPYFIDYKRQTKLLFHDKS